MQPLDLETALLVLENFDALAITNSEGKYIYANQYWLSHFDFTLEDIYTLHP